MWKNILKIFGILYIPLLILSIVLFLFQRKEYIKYYSQLQERETSIKKDFFIDLFHTPIHNINYWSQLDYPANFQPLDTHLEFMQPYIEIIQDITDYDQFRILDLNGKEIFRVERKGVNSLSFGALQDKSNRSYFQEGMALKKGQIFLSPINLNREYGTIEKPYKPVIRVVAPIFDSNNTQLGIVVINFKMERILNRLKSNIVDNNFYLLNDNMDIITSNVYNEHIPFEVSDTVLPLNESNNLPAALFKKDTTFLHNDHIWSIQTMDLNETEIDSTFGSGLLEIVTPAQWSVVHELPPAFLHGSLMLLYFSFGIFNFLAIVLLLALAYYLVQVRVQKGKYTKELEAKNVRLFKKRNLLKKQNQEISKINNQLNTRNKQLNEFNYLVAHNLKAPVSSMTLIVDLIKKERESEKITELLPKLGQIAGSISELTSDIGEYVSILGEKKIKIEHVDLKLLIDHVKNDFSETLLDSKDFEVIVNIAGWEFVEFSKF